MAYTLTIALALGSSQTGLTLGEDQCPKTSGYDDRCAAPTP